MPVLDFVSVKPCWCSRTPDLDADNENDDGMYEVICSIMVGDTSTTVSFDNDHSASLHTAKKGKVRHEQAQPQNLKAPGNQYGRKSGESTVKFAQFSAEFRAACLLNDVFKLLHPFLSLSEAAESVLSTYGGEMVKRTR
ncbi:hypothetical protein R3P38DRAFT_3367685 [Favolaschia claudopus]|uniref:Uncharacterized protein n=1 Tax=Favolaschia claudopus TaxID=2862362 RepID=A0AAW0A7H0_9AGAR